MSDVVIRTPRLERATKFWSTIRPYAHRDSMFDEPVILAFAASKNAVGVFLGVQTFSGMTFMPGLMWILIGSTFMVRHSVPERI